MKTKEFYTALYKKKWDSCLIEATKLLERRKSAALFLRDVAMTIYGETCSAEEYVGFFLFYHGDDALNVWKMNTEGVELTNKMKEVGKILFELLETELPLMEEISKLEANIENANVKNSILMDLLNQNEVTLPGFERNVAQNIFDIYRETEDKKSIDKLFFELTGCQYHDYLEICKNLLVETYDSNGKRIFLYQPYGQAGDAVLLYNHKNFSKKDRSWDITGVNVPTKKCPNTWTFWRNVHNNELVNTDIPHDLSESEMQEIKEYVTIHRKALVPNMYITESVEWFSVTEEKCISVWFSSNERDHLCMNLEAKANGTMGPFCQIISSESYETSDLSLKSVCDTLQEICEDTGITSEEEIRKISDRLAKEILNKFAWHGTLEKQKENLAKEAEEKTVVLDRICYANTEEKLSQMGYMRCEHQSEWLSIMTEKIKGMSKGSIYCDENEQLLVENESAANAIADLLELLYLADGREESINAKLSDDHNHSDWWNIVIE